jgi:F-type H+-transporting ATPase subunit delta
VKQTILAKRYAKALFAIGKEDGTYEAYSEALAAVAALFESNPEVEDALTNPLYPVDVREKAMGAIVDSMEADKVMGKFLNLLVEKKRAAILPEIAEEFKIMVDEDKNISHGTVMSAVELDADLQNKIKATLEKITGKKVELTASVDPSIIGGVIAKVGDLVLDGSIRTQLASLKGSIKGRE